IRVRTLERSPSVSDPVSHSRARSSLSYVSNHCLSVSRSPLVTDSRSRLMLAGDFKQHITDITALDLRSPEIQPNYPYPTPHFSRTSLSIITSFNNISLS
ncbi:hypothetical protein L9F63_027473, partial [Diploptera punctata]